MISNGEDQVTNCCSDDDDDDNTLNQLLSISAQREIGVSCTRTEFATNSTTGIDRYCKKIHVRKEDTPKEDCKADGECRPQKRRRSAEIHNLTERLRRQRLKEKMRSLQELVPNCNKRDKASTLDDAINYIKNLQYQLQMMSMGAGFTMLHSLWTAMTLQQGPQIPSLPPYQQTGPNPGIGYGNGIGSGINKSGVNFPTNQIGLHSKHCSLPSGSQLGYGIQSGVSSVNVPMNQIGSHSKRCSMPSGLQLAQQGGVCEVQSFQNAGDVVEPSTGNPLDCIIGQYERLIRYEAPSASSSRWEHPSASRSRWEMSELPHIHPFSEASESFLEDGRN